MKQIDSFLNKIMQLEASDLEQSDKKECLLVIEKDPSPCPPTGGCESVSYHSTDFAKQRDYVDNDSNIAGYISMIMAYYRNPELMLRILYG
jgi:hypothetical protein